MENYEGIESRETVKKRVIDNLMIIGIDINNIDEKRMNELIKIEHYVYEKNQIQDKLIKNLKDIDLNVLSISNNLSLTRSYLYNNEILMAYIKYSIKEFNKDNPFKQINDLKKSKSDLETRVENLCDTVIDYGNFQIEINILQQKIKEKDEEIGRLRERNKELNGQIIELKEKIRLLEKGQKKDSTIIPFEK